MTPARSATKRKAPASKTADLSASPTPGTERGRGKKKAAAAAAAKAVSEEAVERDDEDDDEQSPAKKVKVEATEDATEGQN